MLERLKVVSAYFLAFTERVLRNLESFNITSQHFRNSFESSGLQTNAVLYFLAINAAWLSSFIDSIAWFLLLLILLRNFESYSTNYV